ncbi:TetR family transcriptional regulator [Octadecabacter antarcticus 307]|uniref:TetR family transcriptional regulator n=1 Tax=Octadecabacter antarcticus 307 TaxID=391626 RepID=M9RGA5_9RHOB|nr:TetR/AcrR family transcriptional regulator [Octadecabacter antarcticus]AGI69416.1 TetR family transcriptional regulator [Octadecabacter antarcticus 307]
MAGKVELRRATLRNTMISKAETRITANGLKNLRARDLAKDAGCALGAIYNVFGDLNDLVLAVNARTFKRLGTAVADSLADAPQNATQQLIVMSHGYHRFAAENFNTWRALFDIERAPGQAAPDWYLNEMGQLFAYIDAPLSVIFPEHTAEDRALLTKALFSSVHGIVLLGLDEASAGVPAAQLDEMISLTLSHLASKS